MSSEDQLEFNLGEEESETDVAIEQSEDGSKTTAEVISNDPETDVEQESASSHREELESVSEGVQKRIAKLTARMREAERREQAAIDYAKGLQNQTQTLQQRLVSTDYSRLNETKTRLETQQQTLKAIIKRAREEGDIDTETEAQQRLTDMMMEQRQIAGYLQQQSAEIERMRSQPVQQQVQVQQAPQKPAPSPRAERWAEDNPWFGQDRVLTYAAWGIHQTLVEQEGVDPNTEEYYTQLDQRLRDEFPKRFVPQQTRQQRSVPAVAPASRSSGVNSARRTVRLSPSQVAIAKKLGVPIEEYAKYVKE
jgi:hypothetical protein